MKYVWSMARMCRNGDDLNNAIERVLRSANKQGVDPCEEDARLGEFYAAFACTQLIQKDVLPDGELLESVGLVYPKDAVARMCQLHKCNAFQQLIENGLIVYQCDGLVSIDWNKVYAFVDKF